MSDRDGDFGIAQGDDFHGGDDLAGLLDLPSGNEVEVGLLHQMLHVALCLNQHQLLHTWTTQKDNAALSALTFFKHFFLSFLIQIALQDY